MWNIIKKELKVLFSKKISIVILVLYPLILLTLLGIGFDKQGINFKVGVSNVEGFDNNLLVQGFETFNVSPIFYDYDENKFNFSSAFLNSPIFIAFKPLEFGVYSTKIFYENLDFFVSQGGVQLSENALLYMSNKITYEKIEIILLKINDLRTLLISQKEKLIEYNGLLDNTSKQLLDINSRLSDVNFIDLNNTLETKKIDLEEISTKLNDLEDDKNLLLSVYETNKDLIQTIDNIYFSLNNFNLNLSKFEKDLLLLSLIYPQLETLGLDLNIDVNSLISDLNLFTTDYSELLNQLKDVNVNIHTSNKGLVSFITDFNSTFELIKYNVDDTNILIYDLQNRLGIMQIDFNYAQTMLQDSLIKQDQIKSDLNSSIILLDSLIEELNPEKFDANAIASPIRIDSESRYEFLRPKDIAIIFGIVLVLLFNAILLVSMAGVKDKSQSIDVREKLSPKNRFYFFLGRFFAQSIVGLLTGIVMLIFAILVFGFPIFNLHFVLLFLILAIFAFVSIGLFISQFVESESIAILLSLLIVMPMLFLSGLILPTYFMPNFLAIFANILPLTLAKNALLYAIVGKNALIYILGLLAYIIVFLTLVYVFRKR